MSSLTVLRFQTPYGSVTNNQTKTSIQTPRLCTVRAVQKEKSLGTGGRRFAAATIVDSRKNTYNATCFTARHKRVRTGVEKKKKNVFAPPLPRSVVVVGRGHTLTRTSRTQQLKTSGPPARRVVCIYYNVRACIRIHVLCPERRFLLYMHNNTTNCTYNVHHTIPVYTPCVIII